MKSFALLMLAILACGCAGEHVAMPASPRSPHAPAEVLSRSVASFSISRSDYRDRLEGMWMGQSVANWTGLITELDKVEPPFYTDEDWNTPDRKSIFGSFVAHSRTIGLYVQPIGEPWGSDDDTDIEYIYQHLLETHRTSILSPEQIRDGWLTHIYSNEDAPLTPQGPGSPPVRENFLWVSNERAFYLMKKGILPPGTSDPKNNPDFDKIDAQLTTEIFGAFAPGRPDVALRIGHLPVRVTASGEAELAAKFYIAMYALASTPRGPASMRDRIRWMAEESRRLLPAGSTTAKMYDFVKASYDRNPDKTDWEKSRDEVYARYQAGWNDGYVYGQGFDSGINFAASLVSLFYGEGDLIDTIRIGSLAGWDSDNPTATWGGLLGLMLGRKGVEKRLGRTDVSDTYWIGRTRRNFPDRLPGERGDDSFPQMAQRALAIVDRVVQEQMGGKVDLQRDRWLIPTGQRTGAPASAE
jgi:hypothetical protein